MNSPKWNSTPATNCWPFFAFISAASIYCDCLSTEQDRLFWEFGRSATSFCIQCRKHFQKFPRYSWISLLISTKKFNPYLLLWFFFGKHEKFISIENILPIASRNIFVMAERYCEMKVDATHGEYSSQFHIYLHIWVGRNDIQSEILASSSLVLSAFIVLYL